MKTCKKCNGTGEIIVPVEEHLGRVMYGNEQCDECNGTGEVRTNFDRITASSEALAEFIHEAESVYERCAKGDLNCDYCECRWCGLAGRKDLIDWLNEECDNA